jgi:hypothetical protein
VSEPSLDYRDADGYECAYKDAIFVTREKYDALAARLAEAEYAFETASAGLSAACASAAQYEVNMSNLEARLAEATALLRASDYDPYNGDIGAEDWGNRWRAFMASRPADSAEAMQK